MKLRRPAAEDLPLLKKYRDEIESLRREKASRPRGAV